MSPKPTFVLIPGAWHGADIWDKVVSLLADAGYKSVAVDLPSTSGDPSTTFLDDVEAVRGAMVSETDGGRDVVLAVHSYGGHVGQSALKGLSANRSADTSQLSGKVIGLAMMATGFNHAGLSFIDSVGGKPPPFWRADTENGFAELVGDPTPLFYHDLPEEEGMAWAAKLQPQSLKSLFEGAEHGYAGWKDVPVWYLITVEDRGLPVEAQRWMASDATEQGADVKSREIKSGHSPMLSKSEETTAFLVEAASAFQV